MYTIVNWMRLKVASGRQASPLYIIHPSGPQYLVAFEPSEKPSSFPNGHICLLVSPTGVSSQANDPWSVSSSSYSQKSPSANNSMVSVLTYDSEYILLWLSCCCQLEIVDIWVYDTRCVAQLVNHKRSLIHHPSSQGLASMCPIHFVPICFAGQA